MKTSDVTDIVGALNSSGAQYLVVGGLAVVAHGYVRFTQDIDIVLKLEKANVLLAMDALTAIGYRPLIPVNARNFADAAMRQLWIEEKHMIVFQMLHPDRPSTRLDIFVEEPFVFADEYSRARWETIFDEKVPIVHLDQLLILKRAAGRPNDLADIAELEHISNHLKSSHGK